MIHLCKAIRQVESLMVGILVGMDQVFATPNTTQRNKNEGICYSSILLDGKGTRYYFYPDNKTVGD